VLITAGCPGGSPTSLDDPDSLVAGRLIVQAETSPAVIIEQELNDGVAQPQFVARLSDGDELAVLGDVSDSTGDHTDAFEFVAVDSLTIDVVLTAEQPEDAAPEADLDLLVYDGLTFICRGDGGADPLYSLCFDGDENPVVGTITAADSFVLVVVTNGGAAHYQLDVTTGAATAKTITKGDAEDMPRRGSPATHKAGHNDQVASSPRDFVPGELLIAFHDGAGDSERRATLATHGLRLIEASPSGVLRVDLAGDLPEDPSLVRRATLDVLHALRATSIVRFAECNHFRESYRTPNDKFFNMQWHYQAINLPQAWDTTVGDDDIIIAVIDSGIVSSHPDLQGRLVDGYDFISDPARARDGDGRESDPEDPGDLAGGPGLSSFHGTHVAGVIGASTDNGRGIAGVTWQAKIMPLRVIGVGGGNAFEIAEAVRFAVGLANVSGMLPDQPAAIINLSLGRETKSTTEEEAVRAAWEAGIVLIGAAGNEISSEPSYPSALSEVINVSAIDMQFERALYSNHGDTIDLAAPGGFTGADFNGDGFPDGILSTGARDFSSGLNLRYGYSSGTSVAAPHVAGVAALVMAANPDLAAVEVREILETTAVDLGDPGRDDDFGHGLVDAAAAVREARARGGLTTDSAPILTVSPRSLGFGTTETQLRARLFNAGGGFLEITSVDVETTDGQGWLRATTRGSSATDISADEVLITVNRTGQADGVLRGWVHLATDSRHSETIDVTATVGSVEAVSDTIIVFAIDRDGLEVVAETATDEQRGFEYSFTDLPPGEYVFVAGTDRDDDGEICEFGDFCGAWPTLTEPSAVTVQAGDALAGRDFPVARRLLRQASTEQ
jgi:serine protease